MAKAKLYANLRQLPSNYKVIADKIMHRSIYFEGSGWYSLSDDGVYYKGKFATYSRILIEENEPQVYIYIVVGEVFDSTAGNSAYCSNRFYAPDEEEACRLFEAYATSSEDDTVEIFAVYGPYLPPVL